VTNRLVGSILALVVLYALGVLVLVIRGRRADARALAGFVPDCVILFGRLVRDPRLSMRHKWLVAALIPYLAMPIDLVPDFVPVAGQLDDAIVVAVVLRRVLRGQPGLVHEHWPGPPSSLAVVLRLVG
jgi:uncharacterized membrane protein YkvA (DUF1232 family)